MLAVMVMAKGAPVTLGGVPESNPVVAFRLTQTGRPVALKVGAGVPVAVTAKLPGRLIVKVAVLLLVMCGGMVTVRVAGDEVTLPKTLVTMQRNWSPLIAMVAPVMVNVAADVPE